MDRTRARIVVTGEVQGVGYRSFALLEGRALGLAGYVRNVFDGSVELEVEGVRRDIESLVELLRRGPRAARVTGVDVQWTGFSGEFAGFEVRF